MNVDTCVYVLPFANSYSFLNDLMLCAFFCFQLSSVNTSAPLVHDHHSPNGFVGGTEGNLPRIRPELLARLPPPPAQDDGNQVQVVIGSEEWHAEVPSVLVHLFIFSI